MLNKTQSHLWQQFRQLIQLFFQLQAARLCLGIAMGAMTLVFGLALLGLSGWFITATAIAGSNTITALAFDVFVPSASIRFLAIARTAARYAERLSSHDATLSILSALRVRLFKAWSKPQAAQALVKRPAKLLFRLTADIDALDALYLRILLPLSAALIVLLVAALAFGIILTPWLALALVLWLVLLGIVVPILLSLRARRAARTKAYATEALRARVIDLVAGQIELLMAGQSQAQLAQIMQAETSLNRADKRINQLEIAITIIHGVATAIAVSGMLLVAALMVESLTLSAALAAFTLLVLLAVFEPFTAIRRGAVEFGRTLLAVERLTAPLIAQDETAGLAPAAKLTAPNILQLNQLQYCYPGAAQPLFLQPINLRVERGQHLALVGSSGSGKSTLLALISQELSPTAGTVACANFSLLTQRVELFNDSLRGNLLLANPSASDSMLEQALLDAGLASLLPQLVDGLDTQLGEGGLGLSGGQARRLALARVFLNDAPLWLLDEPTAALDLATATDVLQRLAAKAKQQHKSIIIATHQQNEALLAENILLLERQQQPQYLTKGSSVQQQLIAQLSRSFQ